MQDKELSCPATASKRRLRRRPFAQRNRNASLAVELRGSGEIQVGECSGAARKQISAELLRGSEMAKHGVPQPPL